MKKARAACSPHLCICDKHELEFASSTKPRFEDYSSPLSLAIYFACGRSSIYSTNVKNIIYVHLDFNWTSLLGIRYVMEVP